MRWQLKSFIQQRIAQLPRPLSEMAYFTLQRHFGSLQRSRVTPVNRLSVGLEICRQIELQGRSPQNATFFEVGTGWRLNVPLACWLCGAGQIITADLNAFLNDSLINEDLAYIHRNKEALFQQLQPKFGDLIQLDRWERLTCMASSRVSTAQLCDRLNIEYLAPSDASCTNLDSHSVDFHVSCNVLEHIPQAELRKIFREARRVTRPDGLLLHRVDHTDHFSHSDSSLAPIHFLRFSEAEWRKYADNRYAYVNRLREDDYIEMFQDCGHIVRNVNSVSDQHIARLLDSGYSLNHRFRDKKRDVLTRLDSLFVLVPDSATAFESNAA